MVIKCVLEQSLQQEEDEEVKLDAKNLANVNVTELDKNILGKDEDIANQIRSATRMARWCMKHQGEESINVQGDSYLLKQQKMTFFDGNG